MKFNESVELRGHLKIQVFDAKTGEEKKRIEKSNLICKNSRLAITRLLMQTNAAWAERYKIWSIYVGDDSTVPATTQDNLVGSNKFGKVVNVTAISPPDSGIVELDMTLTAGEHNDKYLRECGLFTRGDSDDVPVPKGTDAVMLARQIHGEIYKTSGIAVKYTWRYQITA